MVDIKALKDDLNVGVVRLNFYKVNGDEHTMFCTLNESYLKLKTQKQKNNRKKNDSVLPVWDVDNNNWRSFRVDSVIDWVLDE